MGGSLTNWAPGVGESLLRQTPDINHIFYVDHYRNYPYLSNKKYLSGPKVICTVASSGQVVLELVSRISTLLGISFKYFLRYFKRLNKSIQSTLPTLLLKNLEELKIFFLGPKCKFFHMEESAEFQFRTMYLQIDVTLTESLLKSFMKSSNKMLSNFS